MLSVIKKTPIKSKMRINFLHGFKGRLESLTTQIRVSDLGTGTCTGKASVEFARSLGNVLDDAGHALGKALGGLGGKASGNIIPQSIKLNRGIFNKFEQQVAKFVKANGGTNKVFVKITPKYVGNSTRPFQIIYQVRVNGKTLLKPFPQ